MAPARRARRLRQAAGAQHRGYARQWPEWIAMSILCRFENILLDGVPSRFAVVGGAGETMPAIRARIASCGASVRSWAGATGPIGNAALRAAWSVPREVEIVGYKEGMTTLS